MEITVSRGNAIYLRFNVYFENNGELKPITKEFISRLFDMIFEETISFGTQEYIIRINN